MEKSLAFTKIMGNESSQQQKEISNVNGLTMTENIGSQIEPASDQNDIIIANNIPTIEVTKVCETTENEMEHVLNEEVNETIGKLPLEEKQKSADLLENFQSIDPHIEKTDSGEDSIYTLLDNKPGKQQLETALLDLHLDSNTENKILPQEENEKEILVEQNNQLEKFASAAKEQVAQPRPAELFKRNVLAALNGSVETSSPDEPEDSNSTLQPEYYETLENDAEQTEENDEDEDSDNNSATCDDEDDGDMIERTEEETLEVLNCPLKIFPAREVRNGKVIGEGGFGRVLKGSLVGGTPVVIKLFHVPFYNNYRDELVLLTTLKHKNLVSVLGLVEQKEELDSPQLVIKYFSEGNVLQYMSRHENPEDDNTLGKIALDIVEGCRYLHLRGIIHGNLAARNVLVGKVIGRQKTYFNAKITDVGTIRFAEATGGNYMKLPGSERIVPVRWVPQEIIKEQPDGSVGSDFTTASDVWSFGVVLWELWTRGAIPFGASYSNLRVVQFLKDGYSPLKVYRPKECPPKIVSVMESIFRVQPNERPSFDAIHEHFKIYKGYGKENKSKARASPKPPLSPTLGEPAERQDSMAFKHLKPAAEEKDIYVKKKKAKKNKKLQGGLDNPHTVPSVSGHSKGKSSVEVDGACALQGSPKPVCNKVKQAETNADATIAALLKRVNQLEKEQRRGGSSSGFGGRGASKVAHWQKRSAAPRFSRYHGGDYGDSGISLSQMRSESPPAPPTTQAPPPYTEDPLPLHATTRFSAPLPEYEYPGGSRGSRRGFPGVNGHMQRPSVLETSASSGGGTGEEDMIRKIKRLAEEIEFLRAEKMTQELLKKSAELADIMKVVTSDRTESINEPRFVDTTRVARSISPRQMAQRRGSYYTEEYDDFHYNNEEDLGGHGRWPLRQSARDYHHEQLSSRQRGGGNLQRRPFYKGRGNSHRGGYNHGRYGDGDGGGGSYGYGS